MQVAQRHLRILSFLILFRFILIILAIVASGSSLLLLAVVDGDEFTLLQTVVFENLGAQLEKLLGVVFNILPFFGLEVHLEEDLQVGGDALPLLSCKPWQLFQVCHESLIPKFQS